MLISLVLQMKCLRALLLPNRSYNNDALIKIMVQTARQKAHEKAREKASHIVNSDLHSPMSFESGCFQPVVLTAFFKQHEMLSNG